MSDLERAYTALRILAERIVFVHSRVQMDTPEDKALHAKADQEFRRSLLLIDSVSGVKVDVSDVNREAGA